MRCTCLVHLAAYGQAPGAADRRPGGAVGKIETWTTDAMASGLPELKRFCEGLERDRAAVVAAIELRW